MKLEELRKLCATASPGPWTYEPRDCWFEDKPCNIANALEYHPTPNGDFLGAEIFGPIQPGRSAFLVIDAAFITTARTAMPILLEMVEAAKGLIVVSGDRIHRQFTANERHWLDKIGEALEKLEDL